MRELEIEALRNRIAPLTTEAREVEREGAAPALGLEARDRSRLVRVRPTPAVRVAA